VLSLGVAGSLHLDVSETGEGVAATIDDAGPGVATVESPDDGGVQSRPIAWLSCESVGGRAVGLAFAQQIVSVAGMSMAVAAGPLGGARVVLSAPVHG
jgi:sensor histidine kinase regulating citrate/malate metabolism